MRKSNRLLAAATITVASLGVLAPRADANHQNAEVIIEWNQLLQQNVSGPPFAQARTYAMMHIAMADAVVSIEDEYSGLGSPGCFGRSCSRAGCARCSRRVDSGRNDDLRHGSGGAAGEHFTGASRERGERRQEGRG